MARFRKTLLLCCLLVAGAPLRARADDPSSLKHRFALSLTYVGGGIRVGFLEYWSGELHYYFDKTSSDNGDVQAQIMGGRIARHFRTDRRLQAYAGVEGDRVSSKLKDNGSTGQTTYENSGYAFGAFVGMEYYLLRRLTISMDLGPYEVRLKDKSTDANDAGLDFVLNTAVTFYLF